MKEMKSLLLPVAAVRSLPSLFNPKADVAGDYYRSMSKLADDGDEVAKLIVAQSDAIKAGKRGPLTGRRK